MRRRNLAFTSAATQLLLLYSVCCLLVFLILGPLRVEAFTGTYGINYGRIANNIPSPESVVTLLRAAKIKNVKIFDADHSVLNAFKGSGLELVVSIGNEYLKDMSVNEERAMDWLKENVQPFLPGTRIRGIAVGNEVLGGQDQDLAEALLGAIENVYNALKRLQLTNIIEVSTPHSEGVFANSFPPSSCTFKEDVLVYMKPILDFFSHTGAHFYINAYPFLAYKSDPEHIDINYALFQPNSGVYDEKTNLHYDNMFDAQIDAAYAALEAAGYEKMEVRVSETGWASDGDEDEAGATVQNARTYNYNLRKRLLKKKGTPLRPKIVVQAYIFALFNENLKPGPTSERHYGLFKADGSIAYDIGFTGLKPSAASASLFSLRDMQAHGWVPPYLITFASCIVVLLLALAA
uniref:glucan endo-1,3-beta-D-glucosidase n=1 Tax=Ananas comosus var. bracteatus TaxID=296719 RepID=A0A6V7QTD3_ANACO